MQICWETFGSKLGQSGKINLGGGEALIRGKPQAPKTMCRIITYVESKLIISKHKQCHILNHFSGLSPSSMILF